MTTFNVASPEGAQRYGADVGETVDLNLSADEERAVVAAGWIEPTTKKTKEANN